MNLRTKILTAFLGALAFVVTPSQMTQGQANMIGHAPHVDRSVFAESLHSHASIDLRAIDVIALAEVERIGELPPH